MNLKKEELIEIYGGGGSGLLVLGIIALITLVAGIIDGFTRPLKCNE
ncbi:MAG: hypothetical protein HFI08_05990 [Bacilli bacterium]|jgi:hypothetical protein|nr:hypothetical protein [Bacilli bacterium]